MRQFILLGVDVVLILLATSLGFALRENFEIAQVQLEAFLPYLCATALVAVVFFAAAGVNKCIWRFSSTHDYLRVSVVIAGISVGAVATSFAYNRLEGVARSLPVLQAIMGIMILVGARVIHRLRHMARQRKRAAKALLHQPAKAYQLNILVVGVSRLTETYIQALNELGSGRVNVAGIIGSTSPQVGRLVASHPVLGVARDIENVLARLEVHGVVIDRIVVAMPLEQLASEILEPLLLAEQSRSIPLQFLTEALDLDSGSPGGIPHSLPQPLQSADIEHAKLEAHSRRYFWKVKRGVDAFAALALLVTLSPVFIVIALLVATTIGFPVVFWQRRPGLRGKPFHLYKFRTMGAAHTLDGERLPDAKRVSRVGNFMRRTRLDELPQLLNIFRGDMSFIGPRPLLLQDQPKASAARLLVRPGLTGWAQVVGGRDISPEDKAALDVWYVRNASLLLELQIAARTVPIVLFGERISQALIERARRELTEPGIKGAPAATLEKHLRIASSLT